MKWIGQHIWDQISRFRNDVIIEDLDGSSTTLTAGAGTEPLVMYQPVNDASPNIIMGSSLTESLRIRSFYQSGTQEFQEAVFSTYTAETDADRGRFKFNVDQVNILSIDDDGIDLYTGKGIAINGTDILTDSSGTATLSNIDALDATTIATFETALEANIDTLNGSITIDTDRSAENGNEGAEVITALHVDFDRTVPDSGTYTHRDLGIDLDVTSASLGTSSVKGMDIDVVGHAGAAAVHTATGIELNVSGADTNNGMQILCEGEQLRLSHNAADYATFTVADTGDLTIATVGDGTKDSDLILDADGDIKLEPVAGNSILLDGTIDIDAGVVTGATSITSTAFVGDVTGDVTGDVSGTAATVTGATQAAITTLASVSLLGSAVATLAIGAGGITNYKPFNNANPNWKIGKDVNDRGMIQAAYHTDAQTLSTMNMHTYSTSAAANAGMWTFWVDQYNICDIDDGGIDLKANKGISIAGTDIIKDSSSGTATLSNIDVLDATTAATIQAASIHKQIVNLKGYITLQDDVYDYANPYNNDDEAPFQLATTYSSGTIDSSTEKTQASFFRTGGFHVPFDCNITAIQVQASCSGSGDGNVTVAIVEYVPSEAGGDLNDYPRTVYVEEDVASNNSNNKIKTVDSSSIASSGLVNDGSHIMIMVKGDSDTVGDLAVISVSIELSW